jgi:hypothetical protein
MDRVKALVDRISPLLHRHSEAVQSAALADLLAKWIAGHVVLGDPLATTLLRGKLLREHMKLVRDLTKLNAMQMGTGQLMDVEGGRQRQKHSYVG